MLAEVCTLLSAILVIKCRSFQAVFVFTASFIHLFMAGSGVVRIDSLHFLAAKKVKASCKRRLNQALSVLSVGISFLCVYCCSLDTLLC